ncbi:MAG: hypothetical protein VXY76_04830, partial [Pseudomonadota bacterium]|nr:hypothetical protein [Pseudomonadota bacterium]
RSFQDLPDQQLVGHLDDFFNMLERSMDHSMQQPMEQDLEEIRLLVCDLHKGWETLLKPTTSSPTYGAKRGQSYSRGLLA